MGFVDFLKRNITSINRNLQKSEVINSILDSEQFNNGVINLHRIDKNNAGDFFCAPHHYFKELKHTQVDIYDYKTSDPLIVKKWRDKIINNALVIGGGGLLNRGSFEKQIKLFEALSKKDKKTNDWARVIMNQKDLFSGDGTSTSRCEPYYSMNWKAHDVSEIVSRKERRVLGYLEGILFEVGSRQKCLFSSVSEFLWFTSSNSTVYLLTNVKVDEMLL